MIRKTNTTTMFRPRSLLGVFAVAGLALAASAVFAQNSTAAQQDPTQQSGQEAEKAKAKAEAEKRRQAEAAEARKAKRDKSKDDKGSDRELEEEEDI